MSTYTVIKTINGRQYRYRQTTWREGGRMRTKCEYMGPVAAAKTGDRRAARSMPVRTTKTESAIDEESPRIFEPRQSARRRRGISEFLKELVRKPEREFETEAEMRGRVAFEDAERAKQAHVNDLLTAPTIAVGTIYEIAEIQADAQSEGEPEGSPNGSTK